MTAAARKMPERPCSFVASKQQLPWGEDGPGDHDWWQQGGLDMIWCRVCGADANDESRTHVLFVRPTAPGQLELFGRAA